MDPATKAGERGEVVSDVEIHLKGYSNYLQALQKSPRTVIEYTKSIRQWAAWWRRPVHEFDTDAWDEFTFFETESGCKGTTIRARQSALRGFYRYLRRKKVVKHDPSQDSEPVGVRKRIPEFLTEEQIEAMFKAAEGSPHDTALLELLYSCGLRNTEVRDLPLENISRGFVLVLGKGNKQRKVDISNKVYDSISCWTAGRTGFFHAFGRWKGKRISMMTVQKLIRALAVKAGITKRVYPHLMRHSIATHLLARGCDLAYIQKFLGHDDIATTRIYTSVIDTVATAAILAAHPRGGG